MGRNLRKVREGETDPASGALLPYDGSTPTLRDTLSVGQPQSSLPRRKRPSSNVKDGHNYLNRVKSFVSVSPFSFRNLRVSEPSVDTTWDRSTHYTRSGMRRVSYGINNIFFIIKDGAVQR